jgi:hypothetical protein
MDASCHPCVGALHSQTIIGRQLKEVLGIADGKIGYSVFADKLTNASRAKDRYRA